MDNELNIEECSNNCSILTYFQVMEQVNNFDIIEFEDVPLEEIIDVEEVE
jgi:hypothetical protein